MNAIRQIAQALATAKCVQKDGIQKTPFRVEGAENV
jgi:hypothetical protein